MRLLLCGHAGCRAVCLPTWCAAQARRTTCSALRSIGRLGSGLVQLVAGGDATDGKQPPGQKQGAGAEEPAEPEAELAAKMREEAVALQQGGLPACPRGAAAAAYCQQRRLLASARPWAVVMLPEPGRPYCARPPLPPPSICLQRCRSCRCCLSRAGQSSMCMDSRKPSQPG